MLELDLINIIQKNLSIYSQLHNIMTEYVCRIDNRSRVFGLCILLSLFVNEDSHKIMIILIKLDERYLDII